MRFLPIAALLVVPFVSSVSIQSERLPCDSPVVTSEKYIGPDKNVKVETVVCNDPPAGSELQKRQSTNVCGATCQYTRSLPMDTIN